MPKPRSRPIFLWLKSVGDELAVLLDAIGRIYLATRQLEALFNLSQLLFGLARAEQSNYTFRDLQLGKRPQQFRDAGFRKFRK